MGLIRPIGLMRYGGFLGMNFQDKYTENIFRFSSIRMCQMTLIFAQQFNTCYTESNRLWNSQGGKDILMRIVSMCLILAAVIPVSGCNAPSNPEAEKAAIEVAKHWLTLVDNEQYAESWKEAASFFRGAVTEDNWVNTMQSMRKPLGKNAFRELKSTRYLTQAPGAPDGQYVVIQFKATFENKKSAIETITPMLDQDGKWRVSGYFMK